MIEVDIRTLMPANVLESTSPAVLEVLVEDIASAARAKWVALGQERLNTTSRDYVAGISGVKTKGGVSWIELNGVWPNMLEQGFGQYDLRDTLLNPSKKGVKTSASGDRYRSIMFRIGTPGATGRNFQKATDLYAAQLGAKHGAALGRRAHKLLKKLSVGQRLGENAVSAGPGGKIEASPLKKGELNPSGNPVRSGHANDLFAGATVFEQKTKTGRTQRFYGTFRTISTANPEGWIHPGYKPGVGENLAGEVEQYIARVAPAMLAAAMDSSVKG